MESHEACRKAFKKVGCKNVARGMKLSHSIVNKWSEPCAPRGSGLPNPPGRMAQLMVLAEHEVLIHWLCAERGGYFVKNPPVQALRAEELLPVEKQVIEEQAQLLVTLVRALGHPVTRAEAVTLRTQWEELKSDMERLVTSCERVWVQEPGR